MTHGRASSRGQDKSLKSISSFVAGFKSALNAKIDDDTDARELEIPKFNRNHHFFRPNYHDRVIRNRQEY